MQSKTNKSEMETLPYDVHPKAARVMVVLMIVSSFAIGFGKSWGLPHWLILALAIPGWCSMSLLGFSKAKIWIKIKD